MTASWVVRNKHTKFVIFETFNENTVKALNTKQYEAVPIGEYLASLNAKRYDWSTGQSVDKA